MSASIEKSGLFRTHDGLKLAYRALLREDWQADLIIQHGLGEHMGRYQAMLEDLDLNMRIFLLDARGHGQSQGERGFARDFGEMVRDLEVYLEFLRSSFGVKKPFLLGHSLGGLIAASFALRFSNQWEISALLLSGSAFQPHVSASNAIKKELGKILAPLAGGLIMPSGLESKMLSHDGRVVEDYRTDPLNHDRLGLRLGLSILEHGKDAINRAGNLKIPLYVAHGADDAITSAAGSVAFFRNAGSEQKKLMVYPGLYHEIFNESEPARSRVLGDLSKWLQARTAELTPDPLPELELQPA